MKNLFAKTLFVSAAALLTFSCQESALTPSVSEEGGAVSFTSSISNSTKVTDLSFEPGDQISVTAITEAGELLADNSIYKFVDGVFVYDSSPIESEGDPLSYVALYPMREPNSFGTSDNFNWTIRTDQTTLISVESQDLMLAKTEYTESLTPELVFYHKLSSLIVNVTADVDLTDAVVSVVSANYLVNIKYKTGEVSTGGGSSAINMYNYEENGYKCIVGPQSFPAGTEFVSVTTAAGQVYTVVIDKEATLESGKQYYYYVTIENNEVTYTTLINDWEEGDLFEDPNDYSPIEDATFTLEEFNAVYENWMNGGGDASRIVEDTWVFTDESVADATLTQAIIEFIETAEEGREISLEFPNMTAATSNMFNATDFVSTKFVSFSAPLLVNPVMWMLSNCTGLREVYLPSIAGPGNRTFNNCPALEKLTMCLYGPVTTISGYFLFDTATQEAVAANCDLYVGSDDITGATSTATTWKPYYDGMTNTYTFKSVNIVGDESGGEDEGGESGGESTGATFELADFPTNGTDIEGDTWVVMNTSGAYSDFSNLRSALKTAGRLINLELPNFTGQLPADGLSEASWLGTFSAPLVTSTDMFAIAYCPYLTTVSMPSLVSGYGYTLYSCPSLVEVTLCVNSEVTYFDSSFVNGSPSQTDITLYTGPKSVTGCGTENNIWNGITFKEVIVLE